VGPTGSSCAPLSQQSHAILTGNTVGFSGGAYRKRIADQRARFRASLVHLRPFGLAALIVAAMLAVFRPHEAGRGVRQNDGD